MMYNIFGSRGGGLEPLERYSSLDDCLAEIERIPTDGNPADWSFWVVNDDDVLVCALHRQPGGAFTLLTPNQIDLAVYGDLGWNVCRRSPLAVKSPWV